MKTNFPINPTSDAAESFYNRGRKQKHGFADHPLYGVWKAMIDRCYKPTAHAYDRYGGRGILVCRRWHKISAFIADMGACPDGMSLDRKDNDRGYSRDNCRWATGTEQQINRRCSRDVTAFGKTQSIHTWEKETGIPAQTIWARIHRRDKTPEIALTATCRKGPWKTYESPL